MGWEPARRKALANSLLVERVLAAWSFCLNGENMEGSRWFCISLQHCKRVSKFGICVSEAVMGFAELPLIRNLIFWNENERYS